MSDPRIFNGNWVLIDKDADNMDKLLQKFGLGFVKRKIGKNLSRNLTFKCEDDGVTIHTRNKTSIADRKHTVTLNVAKEGTTEDGRQGSTVISFKDGHLIVTESSNVPDMVNVWTVDGDELVHEIECDGARVRLVWKREA